MNKVIVITGATSGIGKELAYFYQKKNEKVCILGRNINILQENEYKCDVTDETQVKETINKIGIKFGHIDVIINCAGYGISGALELIQTSDAKREFDVNFFGPFLINKYAIKYMQKGSKIIHISSACALFSLPFRGLYCASKSAINSYSDSLRMELMPLGIQVTSICPGDVKTNFTKNRVKIFTTNERYDNRIENSAYNIDKNQEKRMDPVFVAKKIAKITYKKKLNPMYIIGFKYKLLYTLSKLFPKKLLIHFTEKLFNGKKKH